MPDLDLLDQLRDYGDALEGCVASVTVDEAMALGGRGGGAGGDGHGRRTLARLTWVAWAAALVIVVLGIVAVARAQTAPSDPAAALGDELRDLLVGRTFASRSVVEWGEPYPVLTESGLPGGHLTLDFREDSVTWFAGCNWSSSAFVIDGDRLATSGDRSTTMRGCNDAVTPQDTMWDWAIGQRPMLWLDRDGVLTVLVGDQLRVELVDEAMLPDDPPDLPTAAQLDGWEFWSAVVAEGGTGRSLVGVDDEPGELSMRFHDGLVTVTAGCGSGTAPVTIEDGRLVGASISADQVCDDPALVEQDRWLAGFLAASPTIRVSGDRIRLSSGSASIDLAERRSALHLGPIEAIRWELASVVDELGHETTVDEGSATAGAPHLVFTAGGSTVRGSNGCNDVAGGVLVDGSTMAFQPLAATSAPCVERPAVSDDVDRVLSGRPTYVVEGTTLTLGDGTSTLVFRAT